jgi:solute carrier family 10 (sodium/bile acid cotransporter), member 7
MRTRIAILKQFILAFLLLKGLCAFTVGQTLTRTSVIKNSEYSINRDRHGGSRLESPGYLQLSQRSQAYPEDGKSKTPRNFDVKKFVNKNFFLLAMPVAVGLARLFPSLGVSGGVLKPEKYIAKYGVALIFLISGLSLELDQLVKAISNVKLNLMIQVVSFLLWPFMIGVPLTSFLARSFPALMPQSLLDGILILTTLPTTVNMCIILTTSAGGNTAAAICNAVLSNIAGILITPALIFRFFGAQIKLPFVEMVVQLCNKVLLPVIVGQVLRLTAVKKVYNKYTTFFKRMSEMLLLSILWNAFCNAFTHGLGIDVGNTISLTILLSTLYMLSLGAIFKLFSLPLFRLSRGEVVAGMFCGAQKTLAFGLPLVNTIFAGSPNLAAYVAPIMVVYPIQIVLGSTLLPALERYIAGEDKAAS